ncbi:MAG: flagellar hook-length control protein FliK [Phycisphaerales bacterium]|nr:flagellar hook-length control protein FliK [Phycisphaerales bacterium]
MRVLRQTIREGRAKAVLRVESRELGAIRVRMDLREDGLRLRLETQNDTARRLLSDDTDGLRRGLEAAGLRLERFEAVSTAPAEHTPHQPEGGEGREHGGRHDEAARQDAGFEEEVERRFGRDGGDAAGDSDGESRGFGAHGAGRRRFGRFADRQEDLSVGATRSDVGQIEATQSSETLLNVLA